MYGTGSRLDTSLYGNSLTWTVISPAYVIKVYNPPPPFPRLVRQHTVRCVDGVRGHGHGRTCWRCQRLFGVAAPTDQPAVRDAHGVALTAYRITRVAGRLQRAAPHRRRAHCHRRTNRL